MYAGIAKVLSEVNCHVPGDVLRSEEKRRRQNSNARSVLGQILIPHGFSGYPGGNLLARCRKADLGILIAKEHLERSHSVLPVEAS